jgi:tRNA U54 and U55 pseudouridine synthase Pus10
MSKTKPSLLEEAKTDYKPSGRTPIIVRAAKSMSEAERKELLEALSDPTVTNAALSRVLKRRGHNISPASVGQFRRGEIAHVIA